MLLPLRTSTSISDDPLAPPMDVCVSKAATDPGEFDWSLLMSWMSWGGDMEDRPGDDVESTEADDGPVLKEDIMERCGEVTIML